MKRATARTWGLVSASIVGTACTRRRRPIAGAQRGHADSAAVNERQTGGFAGERSALVVDSERGVVRSRRRQAAYRSAIP